MANAAAKSKSANQSGMRQMPKTRSELGETDDSFSEVSVAFDADAWNEGDLSYTGQANPFDITPVEDLDDPMYDAPIINFEDMDDDENVEIVRERKQSKQNTDAENEEFERRLNQVEAEKRELERERDFYRESAENESKKKTTYAKAFSKTNFQIHENKVASIREQLVKAKEDGDTKLEMKLEDDLDRARDDLKKAERASDAMQNTDADIPKWNPSDNAQNNADNNNNGNNQGEQQRPQAFQDWREKNDWYKNPQSREDLERRQYAVGIGGALAEMGYDANSPKFYEEVDKRLSKIMGNGKKRNLPGGGSPMNHGGGGRNGGKGGGNPNALEFSKNEKIVARSLNIDLGDEKTRERYAQEKARSAKRNQSIS